MVFIIINDTNSHGLVAYLLVRTVRSIKRYVKCYCCIEFALLSNQSMKLMRPLVAEVAIG